MNVVYHSLGVRYGATTVFDGFDFTAEAGQVTAILGASGVGKTTLLRATAGLVPYTGEITAPRPLSYLFQTDRLIPALSVWDNLAYVTDEHDRVRDLLKSAELIGSERLYPRQLSGGMARRVALVRAFAVRAPLLLMDEPFSGLDVGLKFRLMDAFRTLNAAERRTALMVTHSVDAALHLSDRIVVLGRNRLLFDQRNTGEAMRAPLTAVLKNFSAGD